MKPAQLVSFPAQSPRWHRQRLGRIGGSEVAPLFGLSPYESRFSLWHRKAGLIGPSENDPEMEWGTRLEDAVRRKWLDQHPEHQLLPAGTFVHPRERWMLANPDGLVTTGGGWTDTEVLEIKTSPRGDGWGPSGSDVIPVYYLTQVQWYLAVLGLRRAHVAVLIGGVDYREYVVERATAGDLQLMVDTAREFLESVAAGERPDIDSHTETYEVVRALHPDIDRGASVDLDVELGRRYLAAEAGLAAAEAERRAARALVMDVLDRAQYGVLEDVRICRRQAKGESGTPFLVATGKTPDTTDQQDNDRSAAA